MRLSNEEKLELMNMQEEIARAGWQWHEHVFNDDAWDHWPPPRNCCIEFTKDKSPHALVNFPRPADCVGWGKFGRITAWRMAYQNLIHGVTSDLPS